MSLIWGTILQIPKRSGGKAAVYTNSLAYLDLTRSPCDISMTDIWGPDSSLLWGLSCALQGVRKTSDLYH